MRRTLQALGLGLFVGITWVGIGSGDAWAQAELFTNGDMTGTVGRSTLPSGWQLATETCDTRDASSGPAVGDYAVAASESPNGGTFFGCFWHNNA